MFLVGIGKLIAKCMWKGTESRIAQAILTKKNKVVERFGIRRLKFVLTFQ